MKKFASSLLLAALLASLPAQTLAETVKVTIDGKEITNHQAVVVKNRTFVPIALIAKELGSKNTYDEKTRTATIEVKGHVIKLPIGQSSATLDGKKVALQAPSRILNSRTYVPLGFVAQAIGASSEYQPADASNPVGQVNIDTPKELRYDEKNQNQYMTITGENQESVQNRLLQPSYYFRKVENVPGKDTQYLLILSGGTAGELTIKKAYTQGTSAIFEYSLSPAKSQDPAHKIVQFSAGSIEKIVVRDASGKTLPGYGLPAIE